MPPTKKATAAKSPEKEERAILHPNVVCLICDGNLDVPGHAPAITDEVMKEYLGWEEFEGDAEPLLVDEYGKKIKCTNNQSNRPFDESRMDQYAQDVLCKKWSGPNGSGKTVNGEAMVVGQYGQTLSMQHRGTALIIACQRWDKDEKWRENWPTRPVMDSVMTFGVDESGDTTITIDNVKPRTGADVFFSDPTIFAKEARSDRKPMCKILDHGVKNLWYRLGLKQDAYAPRRTHSEAKEFIALHPRVQRAVKHIYEQEQDGSLSKLVPLGTASALLYLMGAAGTTPDAYRESQNEVDIDWKLWDKATDFWTHLSVSQTKQGDEGFKRVRKAIRYLSDSNGGSGGGSTDEKVALIVKAWLCYSADLPMSDKNLGYEFTKKLVGDSSYTIMIQNGLEHEDAEDDDGNLLPIGHADRKLTETPSVGGVDLGDPDVAAKEEREKLREAAKADKQRQRDAEKALKAQSKAPPPAESLSDILARIHKEYPGELLVWPRVALTPGEDVVDLGAFDIAGSDALIAAKDLDLKSELKNGLQFLRIPKDDVRAAMDRLKKAGRGIGWCGQERGADGTIRMNYLGKYLSPGGYENKPEDPSPKPAEPVVQTTKAKAKPVEVAPEPAAAPKAKAKVKAKAPVLRGGK